MENTFHYLLMSVQAMFQKKLLDKVKYRQLTTGQPKILDYLCEHDGASQKDIASACHIEPGSLTSILNRMEQKNMIERRMLNGNRRSLYVFLTSSGKEDREAVKNAFLELESNVFDGITEEDRETFLRVFESIYNKLLEGRQ